MRGRRPLLPVVVAVAAVLLALAGPAGAVTDLATFDAQIEAELRRENPQAIDAFTRANAARARNELDAAADGYRQVLRQAPRFFHALRRLCGVEIAQGRL